MAYFYTFIFLYILRKTGDIPSYSTVNEAFMLPKNLAIIRPNRIISKNMIEKHIIYTMSESIPCLHL